MLIYIQYNALVITYIKKSFKKKYDSTYDFGSIKK